jgi:hypothetical protein
MKIIMIFLLETIEIKNRVFLSFARGESPLAKSYVFVVLK